MPDPKLPAAKRRLATLLRDEELGPKLVRLSRGDERRVLDLVYENRGREARATINDLDAARRRKRTLGGKARAYRKLGKRDRTRQWERVMREAGDHVAEFWKLYRAAVLGAA